jgi:zinc protease
MPRPIRAALGALMAVGLVAPCAAQRSAARPAAAAPARAPIDIPYQQFRLNNGLTLIVHEDHKAPIVAVNLWYHVGSKNERPGRTGFAHLFEHLMFNGSQNFNDDFFKPFDRVGVTDQNGTTNEDRTNYFQNVPVNGLDLVLWLESDRMGHLLGAIDTARLNEQRGVVQNEKRQGENEPYGQVWNLISENTYPRGHPYSWSVIGSMEDLNAASLDDVREWFRTYYGPNNAVLVVAGDVNPEQVRQRVEHYFGDIPPGPPIASHEAWIAPMTGTRRQRLEDRVPQARIYKVWNIPQWGTADADNIELFSDVLALGKTSRLYERLVYRDQIATDVSAFIDAKEIGGQLMIYATVRPGGDMAAVERALDEEIARLLRDGPTATELARVKTQNRASFLRGIERIGGFGGKSDVLAQSMVYGGRPDAYKTRLQRFETATIEGVRDAARRWMSDGVFVLEVHPYPELAAGTVHADRTRLPDAGQPPVARFPTLQRATLSNGMRVILAQRDAVPVVNLQLLVDAGYAADQGGKPGTASLAMNMMDEGTRTRSALQISEELAQLGATLGTGSNLDMSFVSMSALRENLERSMAVFADVTLNPAFPQTDFERLRRQQLAGIAREKVTPIQMALRVFPGLLYGANHAYGNPLTGSGTEASVQSLTRDDLVRFHQTWLRPNNATLVVVGNTTLAEITPMLERHFAGWQQGPVPTKNVAEVQLAQRPMVYLVDRPGSQQSLILAGNVVPGRGNPNEIAFQTMNQVLGGDFSSRINMNLRENKHWSYGSYSFSWDARGQRPYILYAPVQTDKTRESLAELVAEVGGIRSGRPPTAEELANARSRQTLSLPGQWETNDAVRGSIVEMVQFGLPENYFDTFAQRVNAMQVSDVTTAANQFLRPEGMVWVVVGDRSKIEAGIRELNLGEIRYIDADGRPVN